MLVRQHLKLILPAILVCSLIPAISAAQSQDPESVTEAARRAREKKKSVAKPAKSFTNDDVKPAQPDTPPVQDAAAAPNSQGPDGTAKDGLDPKDPKAAEKNAKELADLKEQVKQAQADFDLYQRARALQEDNYYSNPSYARDTTGKAKLETLIQQAKDKKRALEELRAKLETMLKAQPGSADTSTPNP
jgi:hypothetical protein